MADRDNQAEPQRETQTPVCEHRYVYSGLRYFDGGLPATGGSVRPVYYGHAYYCERCLTSKVERIAGEWTTYGKRLEGSTPATIAERDQMVPVWDRGSADGRRLSPSTGADHRAWR